MTDDQEPKAWDQLPGESGAAYARFLIYRNLGPSRSLDAAYRAVNASKATKSNKPLQASAQWGKESSQFEWVRRSEAWDVEVLTEQGREVVKLFILGLQKIARKAIATLEKETIEPGNWESAVSAISTVGNFISGEAVAAVQSDRQASSVGANK